MEGSELQEIKPVYIHEARYLADDEISLVDFAMVLVRRWKMITVIIISIIALGLVYALKQPKNYTFSTSIEIGSQIIDGDIKPFTSPQNFLAKLQYNFIPQTLSDHQLSNPEGKNKYKIKSIIHKNSDIIVLEIQGTEDQADLFIKTLNNVTSKATQDHKRIYEAIKQNLTASIKQTKAEIALLISDNNKQTERIQFLKDSIDTYNSKIVNLQNTREISSPMQSIEPIGHSRKLIVIIAAFSGIFLAVFVAFFTEFASKVKKASLQSSADN